jgi:hypothetical protein
MQNPIPYHPTNPSKPAVAERGLLHLSVDAAKLDGVPVGQVVHGSEAQVEPGPRVVNGQHVDRLAVVGGRPAGAAVGRVPARDSRGTADVGERSHLALGVPGTQQCQRHSREGASAIRGDVPVVPGDETVLPVRAGNEVERTRRIIVARVVAHCASVSVGRLAKDR